MTPTPQELIAKLGLEPHQEGGWFRQVYKSATRVQAPQGSRSAVTTKVSEQIGRDASNRTREISPSRQHSGTWHRRN